MDGSTVDVDQRVRLSAFAFLIAQAQRYGEVLPRSAFVTGFISDGTRVPLMWAVQLEVLVQWLHRAKAEVESLVPSPTGNSSGEPVGKPLEAWTPCAH